MWPTFAKCDKSKIQKLWPRYEKKSANIVMEKEILGLRLLKKRK